MASFTSHVFASLIVILIVASDSFSCLCDFEPLHEEYEHHSVVFTGKVVAIQMRKMESVGMVLKEAGTLETSKQPRVERSFDKVFIVSFEVLETFKGTSTARLTLYTTQYLGGGCGSHFLLNETYLVFAGPRGLLLDSAAVNLPRREWTKQMVAQEAADRYNDGLPPIGTSVCSGTTNIKFAGESIERIRGFLQHSFLWSRPDLLPFAFLTKGTIEHGCA